VNIHITYISENSSKLKEIIFPLLTIFIISSLARAQYGGGTGEPNNPHLISEPWHMNSIGGNPADWGDYFKLTKDVDLGSYTATIFNIIGSDWDAPFTGTFDGNGYKILNFTYGFSGTDSYKGIFGMVNGPNAEIKNLGLINPNITGGQSYSASLVGRLINGTISNCYCEGGSVNGGDFTGGLVGNNYDYGTVTNCYATTSVSGDWAVGGLVGLNDGMVTDCYATGGVYGDNEVGGLAGRNDQDDGTISNCYSSGNVEGNTNIGGLVGENNGGTVFNCYAVGDVRGNSSDAGGFVGSNDGYSTSPGIISNSYAIGDVLGSAVFAGGFAGSNSSIDSVNAVISKCYSTGSVSGDTIFAGFAGWNIGTIDNSFWDKETSEQTSGVGTGSSSGISGKTTSEMQTESTFTSAAWDFIWENTNGPNDIWTICEGMDYPKLTWQFIIGDFDSDDDVDFVDFANFATHWVGTDSGLPCGGTDLTGDGNVRWDDLREFTENWLVCAD